MEAHEVALKKLEERRQYASLKERLQDDEWVGIYLDLTEQQFWLDPVKGMRYILPIITAVTRYHPSLFQETLKVGKFFKTKVKDPYIERWELVTTGLSSTQQRHSEDYPRSKGNSIMSELDRIILCREALKKLARSVGQRPIGFPQPLPDYSKELEAVLWWQLGDAEQEGSQALKYYERALALLEQESALKEDAAAAYIRSAWMCFEDEAYAQGIDLLNRATELAPDDAWNYYYRGFAYGELKEYRLAIQDYKYATRLSPDHALTYYYQGIAFMHLNNFVQAVEDFTRAIELDSTLTKAYTIRGLAYYSLKEYERAIEDYNRVLELDPKHVYAYYNRGLAYADLKEYERAIVDYTRTIDLDPKDADTYIRRGLAYLWLKNAQAARTDYNNSYELDPSDVNTAWMAEWAAMNRERSIIETAECLEKIAEGNPQDYVAYICRGVASGLRGKLKDGLVELEKAISLEPEQWDAYFWKGMLCAYYYKGRYQQAAEAIEKALQVGLPPVFLTPLYWLEKDRPDFFEQCAKPLLEKYGI